MCLIKPMFFIPHIFTPLIYFEMSGIMSGVKNFRDPFRSQKNFRVRSEPHQSTFGPVTNPNHSVSKMPRNSISTSFMSASSFRSNRRFPRSFRSSSGSSGGPPAGGRWLVGRWAASGRWALGVGSSGWSALGGLRPVGVGRGPGLGRPSCK